MRRTFIVGDIHGCYDELIELLDAAAIADDDLVVSVGDLVDRGPRPAEVVRWFRARPGAVVLMGNHERKHVRGLFSYSQEITRLQLGDGYTEVVGWMRGLPYFFETPEIRVVHAAMVPGVPLQEQSEAVLCGSASGEALLREAIPDGWWHERYTDDLPIAFGHHVTGQEPLLRDGKIWGLDTGACHGLRLTGLSVPDFRLFSVPARADHWKTCARDYQVPVLRARPWGTMSFRKIDEAIADLREGRSAGAEAYLESLAAWAASIQALIPALLERVEALAEELRSAHGEAGWTAAASGHPARPLLFKLARGRLVLDDLTVRCSSPRTTIELAEKLGIDVSALQATP